MTTGRRILTKTLVAFWAGLCGIVVQVRGNGSRGREASPGAVTALEPG